MPVTPRWCLGPQLAHLRCPLGHFSPQVDEVGIGEQAGTTIISLSLDDRSGSRAVVPWWVRTTPTCTLQWGELRLVDAGKPHVRRRERQTVIEVPTTALNGLLTQLCALPEPLAALLLAGSSPEARAVVRDYALEHQLTQLVSALPIV